MTATKWDRYFMEMADSASKLATCDRLHVGAVIVKDNRVVSTGFNGSIHGHDHCDDVGHLLNDQGRCIRTIHAEQNAILHADSAKLRGATCYVTAEPCENCTKLLNQAGVVRVVYRDPYPNAFNRHFAEGMAVERFTDNHAI